MLLGNPQAALGADASGATLNLNLSQTAQGRLGLLLALPSGQSFAPGKNQLVVVSFAVAAGAAATSTSVDFADQPVTRELVDLSANVLPVAVYASGLVTITAAQGFEADVAPRPNGSNNGAITAADWVQVGRFAAGLDVATMAVKFQRADCAPRETLGDGRITIADWVASRALRGGSGSGDGSGRTNCSRVIGASCQRGGERALNRCDAHARLTCWNVALRTRAGLHAGGRTRRCAAVRTPRVSACASILRSCAFNRRPQAVTRAARCSQSIPVNSLAEASASHSPCPPDNLARWHVATGHPHLHAAR